MNFRSMAAAAAALLIIGGGAAATAAGESGWDKVFRRSDRVNVERVYFTNRYGIRLAADLYSPKDAQAGARLPAIAVSGPFGAVKEQVSGFYAQELAGRGYLAVAFDPSYTGQSGGEPRHVASPDINTEDFSAAIDFLVNNDRADPERVGILGICGFGGMGLNAAAIDTRVKATVTSTMYDMSRLYEFGYNDSVGEDARYEAKAALNRQRSEDFRNGTYARAAAVPEKLDGSEPQFVKDYYDFYRTPLGRHERSVASTTGWNATMALSFMNMPLLAFSHEIRSAVLMVHGEKAHSRYFSEDAFRKLKGDNKELLIVPGASHTDLYYKADAIPFDRIEAFYRAYLK